MADLGGLRHGTAWAELRGVKLRNVELCCLLRVARSAVCPLTGLWAVTVLCDVCSLKHDHAGVHTGHAHSVP